MTVHRLLGVRNDDGRPAPGALRHDLVIVDEASMLDLELACALAESIPEGGRLVLAGDRHQLASVEAGAVFSEACASGLHGIVTLQRNYRQRFAPALSALASRLRHGGDEAAATGSEALSGVSDELEQRAPAGAEPIAVQAVAAWEPAFPAIDRDEPAATVLSAFDGHRVLCAMREGPLGVEALNAAVAARVRRRAGVPAGAVWYTGRMVIVTRNRPELGLSNGDTGVCLRNPLDRDGLAVAFDTGGAVRWLPVRQMPAHDDAFAITVHKAQGSEFDSVALVPAPRGHRLNTAELLYTGATRARRRLVLWADGETVNEGAAQRTARHGRLADRIRALHTARDRIEAYHARQKPEDDRYVDALGVELGHRWTAVEAAGL
ncbi:MAG: AAA family ATPase, partial [Gammaproteobacteria bacterium]